MTFEFATAGKIIFGPGTIKQLPALCSAWGNKLFVVTGRDARYAGVLQQQLPQAQLETFSIPGEPSVEMVKQGADFARRFGAQAVIGLGGGSPLDAAKAIALLAASEEDIFEHLEVVGRGRPFVREGLPCVTVPTTSGTGAEVTRNSVLHSREHRMKVSLRSPYLLARVALVDPELTWSLPADVTAQTGMDALTQLIEPFVSIRANPITDGFCREGLARVARSLAVAVHSPDHEARADLALGATLSGLALANAGLGAVHGFAAAIGGMFPAPHGAVCAALLAHVIAANIQALETRYAKSPALDRYDEIGRILTKRPHANRRDVIEWTGQMTASLDIPPLGKWGMRASDFGEVVRRAQAASSMKANPLALSDEELTGILTKAL